jgi:mRNA interferase RelE/StbE
VTVDLYHCQVISVNASFLRYCSVAEGLGEFERITSHIKTLSTTTRLAGCRKMVGSKGDWRIRVGEYRVIYEIDDEKRAIMIMRFRHHKEAHR